MILLGISDDDTESDVEWLAKKLVNMRIFSDQEGKMNLSVQDVGGEALIVSQFTLFASTRKGNRPSFIKAGSPEYSKNLYQRFIKKLSEHNMVVKEGIFGADMKVHIVNDGPVTILVDTKTKE